MYADTEGVKLKIDKGIVDVENFLGIEFGCLEKRLDR